MGRGDAIAILVEQDGRISFLSSRISTSLCNIQAL